MYHLLSEKVTKLLFLVKKKKKGNAALSASYVKYM